MNELELDDLPPVPAASLLASIDAEQTELLAALDELNLRLETVLRDCGTGFAIEVRTPLPAKAA